MTRSSDSVTKCVINYPKIRIIPEAVTGEGRSDPKLIMRKKKRKLGKALLCAFVFLHLFILLF